MFLLDGTMVPIIVVNCVIILAPINPYLWIPSPRVVSSIRATQYILDMTVNAKIPDNLVHKLPFECFRNEFQCLERLPFNFKITVFLFNFWWYPSQPFWPVDLKFDRCRTRKSDIILSLRIQIKLSQKKQQHILLQIADRSW